MNWLLLALCLLGARLSAESGASSFGDGYRVGVYADRPGETLPAALRFDNFSASWWLPGSGDTDVTDYTYDPAKPYLLTRIATNGGADKTDYLFVSPVSPREIAEPGNDRRAARTKRSAPGFASL